jgi:hypothetical protein
MLTKVQTLPSEYKLTLYQTVTKAQLQYDVLLHIDPSLHSAVLLEISQTLAASTV